MNFSFTQALLGGVLIGLSASMLLIVSGRVAGISGIVGGLLKPEKGEVGWRLTFVLGLLSGSLLLAMFRPQALQAGVTNVPVHLVMIAGLLVGAGTQIGGGCTSGHGVCGISRGSKRSIAATLTFMATAAAATFVVQHVLQGGGS